MYYERTHRHDRGRRTLSADKPPIDWSGILQGTVTPKFDFNVTTDPDTKKTLYATAGILGGLILIGAIVGRS